MNAEEYAAVFDSVNADYEAAVAEFGVPFEESEAMPRSMRASVAAACSCHFDNGGASLWRNWISPACLACRTGERSITFFSSLKCTRNCFFCFNANQEGYNYWRNNVRDIASELRAAHGAGEHYDYLAVTGGEPLLHKPELYAFLDVARNFYPNAHVRLYTSGDGLDEECLAQLRDRGLHEIRFSVKLDARGRAPRNPCGSSKLGSDQLCTLSLIERAVPLIPDVMVEMPVAPGDEPAMRELLVLLDAVGVQGVNLLEFGFPLANAKAFCEHGLMLRRQPYAVLYNYWYAGGVPVAGSEAVCLRLLAFAEERGLRLGVHYCSLDNKTTGQIYQQNKLVKDDRWFAQTYGWLTFDPSDYFLKCVKVVGDDALNLRPWAQNHEWERCAYDDNVPSLAFPLDWLPDAQRGFPEVRFLESLNVLESDAAGAPRVCEVSARLI